MLSKLPNYVTTNLTNFESLKYILVEGEIVTVAGLLSYNTKQNEFQITNPLSIIGGGSKMLAEEGIAQNNKHLYKIVISTIITASLAIAFYAISVRRKNYIKSLREKNQLAIAEHPPSEIEK